MLGFYKIYNKDSSFDRYIAINELDKDVKNEIRIKEQYLECGCRNDIRLRYNISKDNRCIPAKRTHIHSEICLKSISQTDYKKNIYESGREVKETGEITINPEFSLIPKNDKNPTAIQGKRGYYINENSNVKGTVSLFTLQQDLNLLTWNNKINKNYIPKNKEEMIRFIYGQTFNYKLTNKTLNNPTLNTIWFDFKNPSKHEISLVYANIIDVNESKYNNDNYYIKCSGAKNWKHIFNIKKELYNNSLQYVKVKREEDISILAVVHRKKYLNENKETKYSYEIIELSMINVNDNGVFSESSYEIEFYNYLCENKIFFTKPFSPMIEYEGMKCDGIIKPKKEDGKVIFIEIFGINDPNNTLGYLNTKEHKKTLLLTKLKSTHKLLEWDATNNPMPTVHDIYKIINE